MYWAFVTPVAGGGPNSRRRKLDLRGARGRPAGAHNWSVISLGLPRARRRKKGARARRCGSFFRGTRRGAENAWVDDFFFPGYLRCKANDWRRTKVYQNAKFAKANCGPTKVRNEHQSLAGPIDSIVGYFFMCQVQTSNNT